MTGTRGQNVMPGRFDRELKRGSNPNRNLRRAKHVEHVAPTLFNDKELNSMDVAYQRSRRKAPLETPSRFSDSVIKDISAALTLLLADFFALYIKTKNFHWHISGPNFRGYHLMLDEQGDQILAATDDIAERVRKLGGTTIRSIGHIGRQQRILDNDAEYVSPNDMLAELRDDNSQLVAAMLQIHELCDEHGDVATASLLENWIDEGQRRVWFLFETTRSALHES
jgi:starvation-inducible DNA-binding protein